MLLYKYKGASQLLELLDIAVHERLYCQSYSKLNDPFEGQFRSVTPPDWAAKNLGFPSRDWPRIRGGRTVYYDVEALSGGKRVCSLSATPSDVRMWSLYAESHTGVAIEIDFARTEEGVVRQVNYVDDFPKFAMSLLENPARPEDVLTCKTSHWDYEMEYRIIREDEYFPVVGQIRRVILGIRASPELELLLTKILRPEVTISRAFLDHAGICVQAGEIIRPGDFA